MPSSPNPKILTNRRPQQYKTKRSIIQMKRDKLDQKKRQAQKAVNAFHRGEFKSLRGCAKFYKIPKSTLYDLVTTGSEFQGPGRKLRCLTPDEESKIVSHVKWRASVGCGLEWRQLQSIIQEVLLGVKSANPDRITGYEDTAQLPNVDFCRRLALRHNLSLRRTSEITKGRQILTKDDLQLWQMETENFLFANPDLRAAMLDPRRIFNQDETAIEVGASTQRVLADKDTKILYSVSGSSREHITASYVCGADNTIIPPRCIYKGVRNVAVTHLKDLPQDGKSGRIFYFAPLGPILFMLFSGQWKFSVSDKGYITRSLYVEVLADLDSYLTVHNIPRPVVLFIDGANPHISLEAAAFCKQKLIQPWLLKPNMTHILQPCDLTFFSSLKKQLKKLAWDWQSAPSNAGNTLNKYSIVALLHQATELCLEKPGIISNGFRRAGISPWDPSAPDISKLLPGTVFQSTTSQLQSSPQHPPQPELVQSYQQLSPVKQQFDPLAQPCLPQSPQQVDSEKSLQPPRTPKLQSTPMKVRQQLSSTESPFPRGSHQSSLELSSPQESLQNTSKTTPYWTGNTQVCSGCDRRILSKFYDIHISSCMPVVATPEPITNPVEPANNPRPALATIQEFSMDDRLTQLQKYEVLMLSPNQVKEFTALFEARQFNIPEPLYHCWLTHKLASIPTESEALDRVLSAHTASQVPKRKNNRKQNLPIGAARYDPTSPEWVSVLEDQENRKKTKTSQKSPNLTKKQNTGLSAAKKKLRV